MSNNLFQYEPLIVKCNNMTELKGMLTFGEPGLPWMTDWYNLDEHFTDFPVYARIDNGGTLGIILSMIFDESKLEPIMHIINYSDMRKDIFSYQTPHTKN